MNDAACERAVAVVQAFIERINAGDPDGIFTLAAEEHVMVDAVGDHLTGTRDLRGTWTQFFSMFSGYRIEPEEILTNGRAVAVFGRASGSAPGPGGAPLHRWSIPAAWLAIIADGRVAHWQVYCDTGAMRSALETANASASARKGSI